MKKYMLTTVLLLLAIPLVLGVWGFAVPAQYGDSFMGELKYKTALLEETSGRRIVIIGGSGAAFGVDSARMEEALPGYRAVNFGMYAALGTDAMLDLARDRIRAGDIVILMPEEHPQALSGWFDADVMWQGLDGAFSLLADLPAGKLGALAAAFPAFAGQKFRLFLSGGAPADSVYARASFDDHGDIRDGLAPQNIMTGGFDASSPVRLSADLADPGFLASAAGWAAEMQQKGAEVWFAFCPVNRLALTADSDTDAFFDALRAALPIPVIGDPHDSILDPEWFYDTNYHLNGSGRQLYTRILVRAVKAMLGDSSPTEIPLPPKPAPAETEGFRGDDRDAACFLYEGGTVVGLTAEGLRRTALLVPSFHGDTPVTAIASGAFSASGVLQRVTLQENVSAVADGAFAGCTGLENIFLTSAVPAVRVGSGLLTGCDARIRVPEAGLSAYRTDYFFSAFGSRILPY